LTVIFCSPAFHKAHTNGAHLSEFKDGFKSVVDRLREQLRKLLVVEDLERAACRNLADGGWMESVVIIAITRLDENGSVREALGKHFTAHVVKVDAFADVSPRVFDGGVSIDVREETETESVVVVRGIREAVDNDGGRLGVEDFADAGVELVISDRSPIGRFFVRHRVHVLRDVHGRGGGGGRIVVVNLIRRWRRVGG